MGKKLIIVVIFFLGNLDLHASSGLVVRPGGILNRLSVIINHITTLGAFSSLPEGSEVVTDYAIGELEREIWQFGKNGTRKEFFAFQFYNEHGTPIITSGRIGGKAGSAEVDYDRDLITLIEPLLASGEIPVALKFVHNHNLPLGAHEFSPADIRAFRSTRAILEEVGLGHVRVEGVIVYKGLTGILKARAIILPSGISWRLGDYRISKQIKEAIDSSEGQDRFARLRRLQAGPIPTCGSLLSVFQGAPQTQ